MESKTCIKCKCNYKHKEIINMVFKNQLTKICTFCKKLKGV